jgi:hypothetical protein
VRNLIACLLTLASIPALSQTLSGGSAPSVDTSSFATQSQLSSVQAAIPTSAAMAAAAPVQAVNTKTGMVTVPTLCRQQSTALAIPTTTPSAVSWTFPNTTCAFSTAPSCWMDVSTTTTGYVFDYPLNTARTTSAVTYTFTAHATALTISLGALTLSAGAPINSTVTMTCTAPPA